MNPSEVDLTKRGPRRVGLLRSLAPVPMEPLEKQPDFAAFYAKHSEYVRRQLVRRGIQPADLDDVEQEAFVVIHKLLPSFEGRSSVETWLHAVTWRVAANYRRRKRGWTEVAVQPPQAVDEDTLEPAIGGGRLRSMLSAVDDRYRDLLVLHDIGGLSISELSNLTGNARATIRQRVEQGRAAIGQRIWKALTEHDQEAWLERLAAGFAQPANQQCPRLERPIVCGETAISTLDDIVFVLWRGETSVVALEALINVMFAVADASPQGLRHINVVESTSTPPTREGRQLTAWLAGKLGPRVRAAAWAVEGTMLKKLVAPVMNSCLFLGGVSINVRFFDAVRPASSWLAEHGPGDALKIAGHVELMRRSLDEQRPRTG